MPFREIVEGVELGDVVHDDCHVGVTDVGGDQGTETLLTSGVPKLKLHGLVLKMHLLGDEVDTDCWLGKGYFIQITKKEATRSVDSKVSYMNRLMIDVLPTLWSPRNTIFCFEVKLGFISNSKLFHFPKFAFLIKSLEIH